MAEIKGLKEAAKKIKEEAERGTEIIVCADSDLDGVASAIILKDVIYNLSERMPFLVFPDREIEGYGLTPTTLAKISKKAPALLITVDFGISSFEEVKAAKRMGFYVIVVDHHEILERLPEADIIINPRQPGDEYPFKKFAACGLCLKLAEEILGEKMTQSQRENFYELAAIGTLADLMPREGENESIVEQGLKTIENSWRPAFNVFFKKTKGKSVMEKVSKLISLLYTREIKNGLPLSFRFLTLVSEIEIENFLSELKIKFEERKNKIQELFEEIKERVSKEEPLIFEGSAHFEFSLISAVATRLCQKFKKPVFLYKKLNGICQGTARAPETINLVELMKKSAPYLISFGGHPQAAGFRILEENLERFKNDLISNLCTSP